MPKETKKFINPLLRPSPTTDTRSAQPPQPEITEEPEKKSQEEISSKHSEVQLEAPQPVEAAQVVTPQSSVASARPSVRQPRSADKDDENNVAATETSNGSGRRSSTSRSLAAREESQSRDLARSAQSSSGDDAVPYTKSRPLTDSVSLSSEDSALEEPYTNYDSMAFSEDSRAAAKRRRNPQQPFEATHERITLWMDKQLKQRFEALAYQRELPKTALINEAVNALLEKYEAR